MRCYIATDYVSTIETVVAAIGQRPRGADLLVADNFNANLVSPDGNARDEEIVAAISTAGLEYMTTNFFTWYKLWLRDGWTWNMICGGREVRSWNDKILGIDRRLIQNVSVQDSQHNINHYLVLGCVHGAAPYNHLRYLRRWRRFLLNPTKAPGGLDCMFVEL